MTHPPAAPGGQTPRKVTIEYSRNNHDFVITDSGGDPEVERQIGDAFAQVISAMLEAQGVDTTYTLTPLEPSELETLRAQVAARDATIAAALKLATTTWPATASHHVPRKLLARIEAVLRGEGT